MLSHSTVMVNRWVRAQRFGLICIYYNDFEVCSLRAIVKTLECSFSLSFRGIHEGVCPKIKARCALITPLEVLVQRGMDIHYVCVEFKGSEQSHPISCQPTIQGSMAFIQELYLLPWVGQFADQILRKRNAAFLCFQEICSKRFRLLNSKYSQFNGSSSTNRSIELDLFDESACPFHKNSVFQYAYIPTI